MMAERETARAEIERVAEANGWTIEPWQQFYSSAGSWFRFTRPGSGPLIAEFRYERMGFARRDYGPRPRALTLPCRASLREALTAPAVSEVAS